MKRWMLAATLLLGACGPDYGGLAVEVEGTTLPGNYVEPHRMSLVVGHVVRVHVRPRSLSSRSYESPSRFELSSADPDVARVYRDPEDWRWVLVGRSVGTTCVEVFIDGRKEDCVELVVQMEAG